MVFNPLFTYHVYTGVGEVYVYRGLCVVVRGQLVEISSLLPHVAPGAGAQVIGVGVKCLYPLKHLAHPLFGSFVVDFVF